MVSPYILNLKTQNCSLIFPKEIDFLITLFQIQLLADLNLKKTPQLVELVDDSKVEWTLSRKMICSCDYLPEKLVLYASAQFYDLRM